MYIEVFQLFHLPDQFYSTSIYKEQRLCCLQQHRSNHQRSPPLSVLYQHCGFCTRLECFCIGRNQVHFVEPGIYKIQNIKNRRSQEKRLVT